MNLILFTKKLWVEVGREEDSPNKRKCKSWTFETVEENNRYYREEGDKTLELFPLHPEGR